MIDAIRTARWGVAAIALATSAGAVADGPVKLLASSETTLEIQLTTPYCPYAENIVAEIKRAVEGVEGVQRVEVERACMKES